MTSPSAPEARYGQSAGCEGESGDPPLPIAVVSDAHLDGPGGDGADLRAQLDELDRSNCRFVLFMGDLFHVWVGDPRFETDAIRALLPCLAGLGERGLKSYYVEGNRDFFIATGAYARLFESVSVEHSFEYGGVRYLAVHGDRLNDRDWRYRFWRWLSKSALSRFLWLHMPSALVRRLAHGTEERLARTNFAHKTNIPEEVIRRYGDRRLAEGHDVLLLGHFHVGRVWTRPGGEVRLLDAWYNKRRLEWLRA